MKACLACRTRFDSPGWKCPACGYEPAYNGTLCFAPEDANADHSFEARSFERLAGLEGDSFWFRSRNRMIFDALVRNAPDVESFLEVGCGTGYVLKGLHERFPSLRLVGGELLEEGLRIAKGRIPEAELLQLDARRLPFDSEFDAAGAFDVIEHIDEDEDVLAQLHQAVRPGGTVLLTVPQHMWLWSVADDYARHRRRYSRRELTRKLAHAGFELCEVSSFVTLLLPAMAAFRLLQWRRKSFEPGGDLRVSVNARSPLETIMRIEESLIRRGVSLPVGGSLLAVARRL